ncbi:MAG: LacI family DNA-binding transcriptional regulator [Victivallales bacterium]|nr:LacI family DNA-binding transcriptional regulator [Victivallales bacterium]
MGHNVTIRDVAKAAGVSITTTSQVLKGIGRYSDATIRRVWDVVNELNYVPNQYAKSFFSRELPKHQKTGLLLRITYCPYNAGLLSIASQHYEPMRMFYFEQACMAHDCSGVNYRYRHQNGFRNRLLLNDLVDGVVFATPDRAVIENIKKRLPAVLTDIPVEPEDIGLSVINPDLPNAFTKTLRLIHQSGIEGNLAVFCGQACEPYLMDTITMSDIFSVGMRKAAIKCGINMDSRHVFSIPISPETNDVVMVQIADRICHLVKKEGVRIVGLFRCDFTTLKRLLTARGLRLPDDVVILGTNFQASAEQGIAVIHYDWEKMMTTTVEVLLQTIDNPGRVCGKYLVPCFEPSDSFLRTSPTNTEAPPEEGEIP